MRQAVKQFIRRHELLHDGATVVVGVSGGPDSLALLHYLWKEEKDRKLSLIAAHAEHGLRGEASLEDYQFVQNFCQERGIFFVGKHLAVNKIIHKNKMSTQMAAREARYKFFREVMEKFSADYLALAQHGDDQIETMLMRQVRGAFSYGLIGIPVRRKFATGEIIRPFLGITRADIEQYCQEENLEPRHDASNDSDAYVRNRFRKYVLPFLKKENPLVHLHFQKLSEYLTEDEQFFMELAEKELQKAVIAKEEKEMVVSAPKLAGLAKPLQRRIFQLILLYLYGGNISQNLTHIHFEQLLEMNKISSANQTLHLPRGCVVKRDYDKLIFTFSDEERADFSMTLAIPGEVDAGIGIIRAEFVQEMPKEMNLSMFVGDMDKISFPLTVRSRKAGDVIYPLGLGGKKKVSRIFIDHKIERSLRGKWPVVVDGDGNIIWIPELSRAEKGIVTKMSKKLFMLTFQRKD